MAEEPIGKEMVEYKTPILSELSPTGLKEADKVILEKYIGCKSGPVCGPGYCPK
jgi:hypothetical protein